MNLAWVRRALENFKEGAFSLCYGTLIRWPQDLEEFFNIFWSDVDGDMEGQALDSVAADMGKFWRGSIAIETLICQPSECCKNLSTAAEV